MGESGPFYLTSVSNGHVLAESPNGQPSGVVAQNRGDQDKPQQWMIEQGEEHELIALRCLASGKYLHANGGTNWSTVGPGEKQWWRCSGENVTAPQACRLSPVEYPNVYLNHFQGIRVAKGQSMKVHMWQWEQPNEFCLTWYFCNAGSAMQATNQASAPASAAENTATDQQTAPEPEGPDPYEDSFAEKIRKLEEKLASQTRELESQKAKNKQQVEKPKAQQKPEPEPAPKPAPAEKAPQKPEPKPLPKPEKKVTAAATNGVAKEMKKDNCTHVILPPPRKIRRKIVGIVYAQEKHEKGNIELPKTWRDDKTSGKTEPSKTGTRTEPAKTRKNKA